MSLIAARATPPGSGGVGIVRLSGPGADKVLAKVFEPACTGFSGFRPRYLHYGYALDKTGVRLDEVLAVFMPAPATFTGEDVAEIHCHGGPAIVESMLESVFSAGARPAERGEFTRRAFLNGRLDLSQAEAVAEMISAPTRNGVALGFQRLSGSLSKEAGALAEHLDKAAQLAILGIDFPEEEITDFDNREFTLLVQNVLSRINSLLAGVKRAKLLEKGARVVLAGAVNVGKSSLFNALCGEDRALVTDIPGTTRDFIEAMLQIDGLPLRFIDTAGLRANVSSAEYIEALGIERTHCQLEQADAVMLVLDSVEWERTTEAVQVEILQNFQSLTGSRPLLVVLNKCDLVKNASLPADISLPFCKTSAKTGENVKDIFEKLRNLLLADTSLDTFGLTPNQRQATALSLAKNELELLLDDWTQGATLDCLMSRLDAARESLKEILGLGASTEILDKIFANFCIGK